jgi:hypothetical protein
MKKFATVTVGGKLLELDAPGLKSRLRKDGSTSVYWEAPAWASGFQPRSVRFDPDWSRADDFEAIAAECRALQQRAFVHAHGNPQAEALPAEGTLGALIELYRSSGSSPFHAVKPSTRATYERWLKLLQPHRDIPLSGVDYPELQAWYDSWAGPTVSDAATFPRRASAALQMLRLLFQFGAAEGVADSARLEQLARRGEFDAVSASRRGMTRDQAARFVDHALSAGEIRLALAQACQFELGLSQAEVIGDWHEFEGIAPGDPAIVFQRRYWAGGLTFDMLDGDRLAIRGRDAAAVIDLRQHPLVMQCLDRVEHRSGPFVVRKDGRPYDRFTYARAWRALATAAGLPADVWNSDSAKGSGEA